MTAPAKGKTFQILATVILCAGSGVGYWLYNSNNKASADASGVENPLIVVHLEPFVVNLADTNEKNYLRVGIDLGVESAGKERNSGAKAESTPMMRDAIISVLSTRRGDELLTAEGKQKLKLDLITALKAHPATSNIREIYFSEFLVQR